MALVGDSGSRKKPARSSAKASRRSTSGRFRLHEKAHAFVHKHGWAHTIILIIGVVALLAVIGGLFFVVGDSPDNIYTDHEVSPVQSELFLASLSQMVNAPLERGGEITVLDNGDEFLPALIEAIDGAQRTINFSVFIWKDGVFSDQVLNALVDAQKRGVAVRVLLDGLGSMNTPDSKFDELKNAGGHVEKFRTPQFGKLTRFHRRNHRRSIVMDGVVGFTGGMAIGDEWLGHAQDPDHWRDMMFKVTGPLARSLQSAFVGSWMGASGEILTGEDTYPLDGDMPPPGVAGFIHLVNSPADDDHSMAQFFNVSILAARETLYAVTPYFIPDKHLKDVLKQKAEAGVDVRLLLPGENIDNMWVRLSAQTHYEDLLESGIRIYEYRPTFNHSKFMVVDGEWSVVGSPNLNSRSRTLDEENAYGILDRGLGEKLARTFQNDLKHSDEIKLDEWRERNGFLKFVQRIVQLLDEQS